MWRETRWATGSRKFERSSSGLFQQLYLVVVLAVCGQACLAETLNPPPSPYFLFPPYMYTLLYLSFPYSVFFALLCRGVCVGCRILSSDAAYPPIFYLQHLHHVLWAPVSFSSGRPPAHTRIHMQCVLCNTPAFLPAVSRLARSGVGVGWTDGQRVYSCTHVRPSYVTLHVTTSG